MLTPGLAWPKIQEILLQEADMDVLRLEASFLGSKFYFFRLEKQCINKLAPRLR
jgi:hypothetical protein